MIWIVLLLFAFLIIVTYQYLRNNIFFPKNSIELINEVIKNPKTNIVFGEMEYVELEDTNICYEYITNKNPDAEVVMLLHGLGQTMLNFPPYFCQSLLDAGFQIVRIDHHGGGGSNWVTNWGKPNKYILEDLSRHALQVINHLNISKFHLIGVSMGGMIAQRMAIDYPQRISSITSIMSSAYFYDPEFGGVPKRFILNYVLGLLVYGSNPKSLKNKIKVRLAIERLLHGDSSYSYDDRVSIEAAHYEITNKKGYNPKAGKQHGYAIKKSGSRLAALKKLTVPALVIHGKEDPLIIFEQAKKCAATIPNCKTLFINGMGHHLPEAFNDEIINAISEHVFSATLQAVA